jgi:ClpA/ClpB-like protein
VFERFTKRARQVVVLAQDEARALRHNYIGTEHILLGLLREEEGLGAQVLRSMDVTIDEARALVAEIVGHGEAPATGQVPFTPRAKRVLELSLREALNLGHDYIGTEHILLALLRLNEGVAAQVLLEFRVDADKILGEIVILFRARPVIWGALENYRPSSPPLADQLVQELERLRTEVRPTLAEDDERAAAAWYRYEQLATPAMQLERAWRNEREPEDTGHFVGGFMPMPVPLEAPQRFVPDALHSSRGTLLLGWVLFAVAFAVGIAAGWLIWA